MASGLLMKRLLWQACVSVLAGLLMSSAVLAEDMTDGATAGEDGDVAVEVGVDDAFEGDPDVAVDPAIDDTGEVPDITVDFGWERDAEGDGVVGDDGGIGAEDGEVPIEPIDGESLGLGAGGAQIDCSECDGDVPEVAIDPMETDGIEVTGDVTGDLLDLPVEAYQNVGMDAPGALDVRRDDVSHQNERGRGRDGDLPVLRRLLVK